MATTWDADAIPAAPGRRRAASRAAGLGRWLHDPLMLPVALHVAAVLMAVAHLGRVVELFYPLGTFAIAVQFYRRSPAHYIGFVCWIFFLSPEVRRIVDFVGGSFNGTSTIMIAPMLAVSLCGISLLKHLDCLGQRRVAPLVLIIAALLYAFVIGMIQAGMAAALFTLVNWIFPPLVGFHLSVTWRHYPDYHRVLLKTWVYGGLVTGIYAVLQYVQPQPWDAFWVIASKMSTSCGLPVPYQLRVWSTMNSPGTFSIAIMSMLLMSVAARGKLRVLMIAFAVPALLLTSVRTCWGGLLLGFLYPLAMMNGASRRKLLGGLVVMAMLCTPVLLTGEASDRIMQRFDTFQNLQGDNSYRDRSALYEAFLPIVVENIAGEGFGTIGLGSKLVADSNTATMGSFDGGLLEVPLVLGWPGTLLYVIGIVTLFGRAFAASRALRHDMFAACSAGVGATIFAMMIMANMLIGMSGMLIFIGVTVPVIALRYAREGRRAPAPSAGAAMPAAARPRGAAFGIAPVHRGT